MASRVVACRKVVSLGDHVFGPPLTAMLEVKMLLSSTTMDLVEGMLELLIYPLSLQKVAINLLIEKHQSLILATIFSAPKSYPLPDALICCC